jgi:hypothetical protein
MARLEISSRRGVGRAGFHNNNSRLEWHRSLAAPGTHIRAFIMARMSRAPKDMRLFFVFNVSVLICVRVVFVRDGGRGHRGRSALQSAGRIDEFAMCLLLTYMTCIIAGTVIAGCDSDAVLFQNLYGLQF